MSLSDLRPGDTARFFGNSTLDEAVVSVSSVSWNAAGMTVRGADGRSYAGGEWKFELIRFADPLPSSLIVTWVDGRDRVIAAHRERVTDSLWNMGGMPVPEEHLRRTIGSARVTALIPATGPERT